MSGAHKRPSDTPEPALPSPKSQKLLHPSDMDDESDLPPTPPSPQTRSSTSAAGHLINPIENMRLRNSRFADGSTSNNADTTMNMGPSTPSHDDDTDDMFPEADKPIAASAAGQPTRVSGRSALSSASRMQYHGQIPGLPNVSGAMDGISTMNDGQKVHMRSGYTWTRDEDAPGYLWMNKKAQEEHSKAIEQIVDKDRMVGSRYGDIGLGDFPKSP